MRPQQAFLRGAICLFALLYAAAGWAAETPLERAQREQLLGVKKIHVEPLQGGQGAAQIRDMLIGSLHRTGLFLLTEDAQQADAFIRGSAQDLIYSDYYASREGLQVRGAASSSERESGESDFSSTSFGIGDSEQSSRRERKHEASAAVRLVLRSGEVIWSTTQESAGGKYRGPAADVAERVARELSEAWRAAPRPRGSP
jgi:hypothetical protein